MARPVIKVFHYPPNFVWIQGINLAPRARFELATLRLTAERIENLSALFGVAYEKSGAIFPSLAAPTPAPTPAIDLATFQPKV